MAKELAKQGDVFTLPLPVGDQTERLYSDRGAGRDRARGLSLRVRKDGTRSWIFFYRFGGVQKRVTLGHASNDPSGWTLAKARTKAHALRVDVNNGKNPQADREAAEAAARQAADAKTVKDGVEAYIGARAKDMKPRSLQECARHLRDQCKPLHGLDVKTIDKGAIVTLLNTIEKESGPVARNRARSTLSAMFGWLIQEDWCERNPVMGTRKSGELARERLLDDAELVTIWKATPENQYGKIVRLLMLTAQRRDEIGSLRWSEIQGEGATALIALPSERTKNGQAHDVPLSKAALDVLATCRRHSNRDLVFGEGSGGYSGWSRSKERLDEPLKLKPWRLHDLRRTAATRMADLGVLPHVIEAVLNHVSGHKAGVAGIYNRSTYAAEKRAALDLWASHLMVAVAKAAGANVTRLVRMKEAAN